jgi:tetratricopeptide (TPR) repeat protein
MNLRKGVNCFLIAFAVTVTASFALGGYLIIKRYQPVKTPREAGSSASEKERLQELLTNASDDLQGGKIEQALITYRQILSENPSSLEAQQGLARAELCAGREELAAMEYERVLRVERKNPTALLELARIYSHRQKSWPGAETKFREYLEVNPNSPEAFLGLARVLAWQGKAEKACEIFRRPDVTKLMTEQDERDYAFALIKAKQLDQAEPLLRRLLTKRPHDFDLKLQLASIYASRKDWNSALPMYESLLRERPDDGRVNLTYGLGLLSLKRYESSLSPLEKASRVMPSNGEAGLGFARALKGAGNLKKASKEFERVMPQYQSNTAITREFADLLLEKRDYRKSEKYYKDAYGLGLRDDRLLVGLSGALQGNGKPKEALPYLEDLYSRNPTDRLTLELARLYQKLGRKKQALELLAKLEHGASRRAAN